MAGYNKAIDKVFARHGGVTGGQPTELYSPPPGKGSTESIEQAVEGAKKEAMTAHVGGAMQGAAAGAAVGGPFGAAVGGIAGGLLGAGRGYMKYKKLKEML